MRPNISSSENIFLIVDVKDDNAVHFYQNHGLIALPDSPFTLFLPHHSCG